MVDSHSESYAVQERELQKRLPTVPPSVIRHSVREVSPFSYLCGGPTHSQQTIVASFSTSPVGRLCVSVWVSTAALSRPYWL